jgi:hypothetical protein
MNFASPAFAAFIASLKGDGWGRFAFSGDKEATAVAAELYKRKILASPTGGDSLWVNDRMWRGSFEQWLNFDVMQEQGDATSPEEVGIKHL